MNSGQFQKGHTETPEIKLKRIESYKETRKANPLYIGELENTYLFNSWRSFKYTIKGKNIGYDESWKDFKIFYNDMKDSYVEGKRLIRINKNEKFSKENCIWLSDNELFLLKPSSAKLEYNGEVKTLKEWALELNQEVQALNQRFYKGKRKNYTAEEILFGKKTRNRREIQDSKSFNSKSQKLRDKASKMISSYKCKDKKKGYKCDLIIDWFIPNIFDKLCFYCESSENIGADRIDNKRGHMKDNVVPCCYDCNILRNNRYSVEEMKILGNFAKELRDKRNILC